MKTAISITKQEIQWHEENRGEGPSRAYEEGFIKGLKHLLDLFQTVSQSEALTACPKCGEAGPVLCCENCGHKWSC